MENPVTRYHCHAYETCKYVRWSRSRTSELEGVVCFPVFESELESNRFKSERVIIFSLSESESKMFRNWSLESELYFFLFWSRSRRLIGSWFGVGVESQTRKEW